MPSFDVVSEIDLHEAVNAVDQANRELTTRFDFKGVKASFSIEKNVVTIAAEQEFQLQQMLDILRGKLAKRGIDVGCLELGDVESNVAQARQRAILRQGLESDIAKQVVKAIKESKLKVQSSIQGEQVRVTGKKRDELQAVMALLKDGDFGLPFQYKNFRD